MLGNYLSQAAPQTSLRPVARPEPSVFAPPQQQNPMGEKLKGLLANPRTRAFVLNMATNLLLGNGLGVSAARGVEGIGRFETMQGQLNREEQERQREIYESDRDYALRAGLVGPGAGSSGGGRGRGGTGGASPTTKGPLDGVNMKEYRKRYDAHLKYIRESAGSESDAELRGRAHILAMADMGVTGPAQLLDNAPDPSIAAQIAADFSAGPDAGFRKLQSRQDEAGNPRDRVSPENPDGLGAPPSDEVPVSSTISAEQPAPSLTVTPPEIPMIPQLPGVAPTRPNPSLGELLMLENLSKRQGLFGGAF